MHKCSVVSVQMNKNRAGLLALIDNHQMPETVLDALYIYHKVSLL